MIHKKIIRQKIKEFEIQSFVRENLKGVGLSGTKLQITPLGEKIIVSASRPGLIVGRKGQAIKKLTGLLKKKFNLENPQIEIDEVQDPRQDAEIIAETIATYLERFGAGRFKSIGHKMLEDAMGGGALGIEILIAGKVPSSRAKNWRFYKGYLKKCGDLAITGVRKAYTTAHLKSGAVGIQVRVMPGDIRRPDNITVFDQLSTTVEEVKPEQKAGDAEAEPKVKKAVKKKAAKKPARKKADKAAPADAPVSEQATEETQ